MEALLDPIFQGQIDSGKIGGLAAVAFNRSGDFLFSKGYGNTTIGDRDSPQVTVDSPMPIFSCTKLVVAIAALQLVDQGKLGLDDHAEDYLPEMAQIHVLHSFDESGQPVLVPQKNKITILHLMTHTAGFTYDIFNADTLAYHAAKNMPLAGYAAVGTKDLYEGPLAAQPGAEYHYGVSMDWLGWIVAKISNMDLREYIDEYISKPLGLKVTGAALSSEDNRNMINFHSRTSEGVVVPIDLKFNPNPPSGTQGGSYLYSTAREYSQILMTILNEGMHPNTGVQLLRRETVQDYLFTDMLPRVGVDPSPVGKITAAVPQLTCEFEFLPGVPKGWSCGTVISNANSLNGRSKGSGSWAGMGNCYYLFDPVAGVAAFVGTTLIPFGDKNVLHSFDALERALYGKEMAKEIGERGSNFSDGELIAPSSQEG